jgi:hypothetical protein
MLSSEQPIGKEDLFRSIPNLTVMRCRQDQKMGTVSNNMEQHANRQLWAAKLEDYFKAQQHAIIA